MLQFLYAPPVLVPVLVAVAIAHGWLYLVHGVTRSFFEALYTPGLLFVALVIVLASGVFHEFGHAAALRYGGGKVRGMGAGFYLIYPALYTDVTDTYRLDRWARVRTSLGGFYFHLVFALGMMALYVVSGQEFLLFVVLVINLDIVYQCLPFVRFDGYWALADLTGIPDFFSQMGAFLRSVIPLKRWQGAKLPNLKPWVKAVFVAYVAVAVPVLSLLLYFFVTRLPDILGAMLGSVRHQAKMFNFAAGNGDMLSAVASVSQAFILFLQMLAIAYLAYGLCWILLAGIRKRVGATPERRAVGAAFVVGVVALVALLWAS